RLHEVSDLIAVCAVLLSASLIAYRQAHGQQSLHNAFDDSVITVIINLAAMLPAFVVPLIVGAVTIAEERQMGLLHCQLTLPTSRFRQCLVKMVTSYSHKMVLAILLPYTIIMIANRLTPTPRGPGDVPLFDASYLIYVGIALMATTVGIFASSLARNSLRA